jgi:hypothetical protein
MIHKMQRRRTGYRVFPATARKLNHSITHGESWKKTMESGVSVKPRLSTAV